MGIRSLRVRSARSGGGGSGCGGTTAGDECKEPADPETPMSLNYFIEEYNPKGWAP